MKIQRIICDKCQKDFNPYDAQVEDLIADTFPRKDICADCFLQIEMAGAFATRDILENLPPNTTLKEVAEMYEQPAPEIFSSPNK